MAGAYRKRVPYRLDQAPYASRDEWLVNQAPHTTELLLELNGERLALEAMIAAAQERLHAVRGEALDVIDGLPGDVYSAAVAPLGPEICNALYLPGTPNYEQEIQADLQRQQ